jgi:hypothetical protein
MRDASATLLRSIYAMALSVVFRLDDALLQSGSNTNIWSLCNTRMDSRE